MKRAMKLLALCAVLVFTGCSTIGTPKPTETWEQRLTSQQCYFAAPNYYFAEQSDSEIDKILNAILEAGLDGPSIELGGSDVSEEYNGRPGSTPVDQVYRKQIKAYAEKWQPKIEARGLVAHVAFLNTNTRRNDKISDGTWRDLANEFIDKCGTRNKIVLPASETDPRTRASIRSTVEGVFRSRMGSQTLRNGGTSGLREVHSQKGTDIPRGNKDLLVVSDSSPAIGYLYGGDWQNGGSPNLANIHTYVATAKGNGVSVAVYSFGRKFDYAGCKEAGKAWK